MLYTIQNGAVAFADNVILHDINFEIRNTEKIAIVGRNGCGKTTLLKLISGEVPLEKEDSDEDVFIAKAGNPQIGYLKQIAFADTSITLEQEIRKSFEPMIRQRQLLEDAAKELERIAKELERAKKNLAALEGKLSNEKFISRAPEAVVNAEREKARKAKDLITSLEQSQTAMQKLM